MENVLFREIWRVGAILPFAVFYKVEKAGLTVARAELLYAAIEYDRNFKKGFLQDHYMRVFSCLQRNFRNRLIAQRQAGLYRNPPEVEERDGKYLLINGRKVLNFTSNDYLGLAFPMS